MIGKNINISKGFSTASEYAFSQKIDAFQIFLKAPHSVKNCINKKHDCLALGDDIKKHKQTVMIHGSYTLNFCSDPDSYLHKQAIVNLVEDLNN